MPLSSSLTARLRAAGAAGVRRRRRLLPLALVLATMASPLGTTPRAAAPQPSPSATAAADPVDSTLSWWLTTADARSLLATQKRVVLGRAVPQIGPVVSVDDRVTDQTVTGVGGAMTESSAYLLSRLPAKMRDAALATLFSRNGGMGASVLRMPVGATDFALSDYTLADPVSGGEDGDLSSFSLARQEQWVLPAVRRALAVRPDLDVMISPWTAPAWMKTSRSLSGGELDPVHAGAYARYLARTVAAVERSGVRVDSMTLVNEPGHATSGYPSMRVPSALAVSLTGRDLPAALAAEGVSPKVYGYDHNWDDIAYPLSLLRDPAANAALAGTAFHCYAGDVSAQAKVRTEFPGKEIVLSECSGGQWSPKFSDNLAWGAHTLLVGGFRSGASSVMVWNLALDPRGGPTNGGCMDCRGVLTVDPVARTVTRNVEYYLLAHVGRFVVPGAVRVGSTSYGTGYVESVAFRNPDGSHALVLHNNGRTARQVTVRHGMRNAVVSLPAGSLATATW